MRLFTLMFATALLLVPGCGNPERASESSAAKEHNSTKQQNATEQVVEESDPMKHVVDFSKLGRKTSMLCVPVPYQTEFEHYVATPVVVCAKIENVQMSIRDTLSNDEVSEPVKVAAKLLDSIRTGDMAITRELMYSPDPSKKEKLAGRAEQMLKPIKSSFDGSLVGTCMFIGEYAYVSVENVEGAISNLVIPVHIESSLVNFSFGELDPVASEFVTTWAFARHRFPDRFPYATPSAVDHVLLLGQVCTQVEGNEVAVYLMNGESVQDSVPTNPKLNTAVVRLEDIFSQLAAGRYDDFLACLSEPAAGVFQRSQKRPNFEHATKPMGTWKRNVKAAGYRSNIFTFFVENEVPADGITETYNEVLVMIDSGESGLMLATLGQMPTAVTAVVEAAVKCE